MFESKRRAFIFIVLAALFAFLAAFLFLENVRKTEEELGEKTTIVVAGDDISGETEVTEDLLDTIEMPARYVRDTYYQQKEELIGKVFMVDITEEEVLSASMVGTKKIFDEDNRVVQLRDSTAVFDSDIEPGDRVDLVATYSGEDGEDVTEFFLLDVEVFSRWEGDGGGIRSLGVVLDKETEVEDVVYMKNTGIEIRVLKHYHHQPVEEGQQ